MDADDRLPERRHVSGPALPIGLSLLALPALLLAGCGDQDVDGRDDPTAIVEDTQAQLEGRRFATDDVTGHDLVEGSTLTLSFEDDRMVLEAGCNTLSGPYVDDDGELRWDGDPVTSLMACDPTLEEQDEWLTALFTEGVEVEDDDAADLVLTSGDVRIELDAQRATPPPSARLNGPTSARPGSVVRLSLSNLGMQRDSYHLTIQPEGAGAVEPRHLTVEPGRSAKLLVKVKRTPLSVELESVAGGPQADSLTIR